MNLQAAMIQEVNAMRSNPVIMQFVTQEAREKVAAEIRQQMNGGTTAKAVELLEMRYENIRLRVQEYVAAGLIGCLMAKYNA